jgi:hypothetical protein
MPYFVERYIDVVKFKPVTPMYADQLREGPFETEERAKGFIVARADRLVEDAEKLLKKAKERRARCHKKFGAK